MGGKRRAENESHQLVELVLDSSRWLQETERENEDRTNKRATQSVTLLSTIRRKFRAGAPLTTSLLPFYG